MPPTLPIDLSNFPSLRTRKALLILDLQNEFLSPNASLPVSQPEGFVDRTLQLAKAFRDSGSGDVFWVRSQFDPNSPSAGSQIIATDGPQTYDPPVTPGSSRGRRRTPESVRDDLDADPEAFLTIGASSSEEKRQASQNLLAGSFGSDAFEPVAASVHTRKDLVFSKKHYSAFESTQLLQRLRTRFATELYICGALTNVSVYATALDAASHGLALTVVEDCCGYRTTERHDSALMNLFRLTGCDLVQSPDVIAYVASESNGAAEDSAPNPLAAAMAAFASANNGGMNRPPRRSSKQAGPGPVAMSNGRHRAAVTTAAAEPSGSLPVRTKVPEQDKHAQEKKTDAKHKDGGNAQIPSTSASSTQVKLSRPPSTANVIAEAQPQTPQSLQPVVRAEKQSSNHLAKDPTEQSTDQPAGQAGQEGQVSDKATKKPDHTSPPATRAISPVPAVVDTCIIAADPDLEPDKAESNGLPANDPIAPTKNESVSRLRQPLRKEIIPESSASDDELTIFDIKRAIQESRRANRAMREKYTSQKKAKESSSQNSSPATVAVAATADSVATATATSTSKKSASPAKMDDQAKLKATSTSVATSGPGPDSAPETVHKKDSVQVDSGADTDTDTPLAEVNATKQPAATEPLCEGDTIVYHNVLPSSIEDDIYERLRNEVHWLHMSHQGGEVPRLVCVQGEVGKDGSMPIYRHPADESPPLEPFTPTVLQIKTEVEKIVGHPLNHALIQLYRTGNDYISEHSDKTLDIAQGSYVCNMSLGAERMMVFRTKSVKKDPSRSTDTTAQEPKEPKEQDTEESKKDSKAVVEKRQTCRVQLPHNSLCRMGLQTNMRWLHAIRQDKRAERDKKPAELAFGGGRISLTFRQIGTFLDRDQTVIWGQGAVAKTRDDAHPVVNGQSEEAVRMLRAFGIENHSSNFDWKEHYGEGFDVLHMSSSPRLFASSDRLVNRSIQLLLADLGITYAKGTINTTKDKGGDKGSENNESAVLSSLDVPVRYTDNDHDRSIVDGLLAIMLYLDSVRGAESKSKQAVAHPVLAQGFSRFQQALSLQDKWRNSQSPASDSKSAVKFIKKELAVWNGYANTKAESTTWIAGGPSTSLADFAFWPVLHDIEHVVAHEKGLAGELADLGFKALAQYYTAFKARDSVKQACPSPDAK